MRRNELPPPPITAQEAAASLGMKTKSFLAAMDTYIAAGMPPPLSLPGRRKVFAREAFIAWREGIETAAPDAANDDTEGAGQLDIDAELARRGKQIAKKRRTRNDQPYNQP